MPAVSARKMTVLFGEEVMRLSKHCVLFKELPIGKGELGASEKRLKPRTTAPCLLPGANPQTEHRLGPYSSTGPVTTPTLSPLWKVLEVSCWECILKHLIVAVKFGSRRD